MTCKRPLGTGETLVVAAHALDRLREHHPVATRGDLLLAVGLGHELRPPLAAALVGRGGRVDPHARYVLHGALTGMFVVLPTGPHAYTVVTYLRFGAAQQTMVQRWFGGDATVGKASVATTAHASRDERARAEVRARTEASQHARRATLRHGSAAALPRGRMRLAWTSADIPHDRRHVGS